MYIPLSTKHIAYMCVYDIYTCTCIFPDLQNTLHGLWIMIMAMAPIQPFYISS